MWAYIVMARLFLIGSSMSYGPDVPTAETWPTILRDRLIEPPFEGPQEPARVFPFGTGFGQTLDESTHLAGIIPDFLFRQHNLLLVEAGTVDAAGDAKGRWKMSEGEYMHNLEHLAKTVDTLSPAFRTLVIMGPAGVREENTTPYRHENGRTATYLDNRMARFAQLTEEFCGEKAIPHINARKAVTAEADWADTHITGDGLHLSALGHEVVAAAAEAVIVPTLMR